MVNASQTNNPSPDGLSWQTAFTSVQQGLNASVAGDEVWVAAATYFENLQLPDGVALYGGFAGGETTQAERNWTNHATILDGRKLNSVVRFPAGATNTTRLDGFTIQNGQASAGGGVLCADASPVIANNLMVSNTATGTLQDWGGGGLYCTNSAALIVNNRFISNVATNANGSAGGGIACSRASPSIVSNLFLENAAPIGGAVRVYWGAPLVAHNSMLNNRSATGGGAMEWLNATGTIRNNLLRGNTALLNGGGITCWFSSPLIINNVILGNLLTDAGGMGGGIYYTDGSPPQIVNNTIVWNQAPQGGNIYCRSSSGTIANNIVAFGAAGIVGLAGLTLEHNCVFGNGANNYVGFPDPTGTNGNISVDPELIADNLYPGFHLQPSSPCRDAGAATLIQPDWLDIDAQPRIQGAAVDIGADESDGTYVALQTALLRVSPSGSDANDGSSWANPIRKVQTAVDRAKISGGEIWVQNGTYAERIVLAQMVHLFGGFEGTETNRSQRNWPSRATLLDGGKLGSVVTLSNLLGWNTVDGFVITNGQAPRGGGIYCEASAPVIANNLITGNVAGTGTTDQGGGAIYCRSASPFITNNLILGNQAQSGGGISCAWKAFPLIANNVIVSNVAQAFGGTYVNGGGALYGYASSPIVQNNFIAHNIATNRSGGQPGYGGGVCVVTSPGGTRPAPYLVNNTFLQNRALNSTGAENGGALYCKSINPVLVNNLIAFNSSGTLAASAVPTFRNNCTFGNAAFNYQGVTDPTGTNGNFSADPLLVNPGGDFHLASNSPCVDTGDDSVAGAGMVDLDGQPRLSGAHVDIGADEVGPSLAAAMLSIINRSGYQFTIHVEGSFGSQHVLEWTSDFNAWVSVWTNRTLPFDYLVQIGVGADRQFYRVVTTP